MRNPKPYQIVIPVYPGVDLMDIAAPKEVFSWLQNHPGQLGQIDVLLVAESMNPITTRDKMQLLPDATFSDKHVRNPAIFWVPGGAIASLEKMLTNKNHPYFEYLKKIAPGCEWMCSVCEGALLFAKTGLLDGHSATTHWQFMSCMAGFPEVKLVPGYPRYVKSGNRITGGGISSGIDEALYLVELIAGTDIAGSIQQTLQYYPQSPVDRPLPATPPAGCPVRNLID